MSFPLLQRTLLALFLFLAVDGARAASILFIGNSFTFGHGSAVHYYRAGSVADLNGQGVGGVPALFKSFTSQAGLNYDVYLETEPGVGIEWHLEHRAALLGQRPWDEVIMNGYSTLDQKKPGDPAVLVAAVGQMTQFLRTRNPAVELRLIATWPRADQVYDAKGAWYGKSLEVMTRDIRAGYAQAVAATPGIKAVIPVGDAWMRAIHTGIAAANPYHGIDAGQVNLWTFDSYHASTFGYYLDALMVFGSVTGRDPRSLGVNECSGYELGLSTTQIGALQQVAFDELAAGGGISADPFVVSPSTPPLRCIPPR
jgi:hypothetical protein